MFHILRKSLSDESSAMDKDLPESEDVASSGTPQMKSGKRNHSGDRGSPDKEINSDQKWKQVVKQDRLSQSETISEDDTSLSPQPKLPMETPEWGLKLLQIILGEFRTFTSKVDKIEQDNKSNAQNIDRLERWLEKAELHNKTLQSENVLLKEKLLDLEYRQHHNNLIFEGILDAPNESDLDCIPKLRHVVCDVPGINVNTFQIERCHHLDGPYRQGNTQCVICAFNWHYDA